MYGNRGFIRPEDLNIRSMFDPYLRSLPSTREEMVNPLQLDDNVTLSPYTWTDPIVEDSDSSSVCLDLDLMDGTSSSASSLALSRAMTDSEIDYDRFRRYKARRESDPWVDMKAAMDRFPPGYLESLRSYTLSPSTTEDSLETYEIDDRAWLKELKDNMEKYFEEECVVFASDDPGLVTLQEALENIDFKALEAELNSF